jgi:hypothetical protein
MSRPILTSDNPSGQTVLGCSTQHRREKKSNEKHSYEQNCTIGDRFSKHCNRFRVAQPP